MDLRLTFTLLMVLFALINYAVADGRIRWDRSGEYEGSKLDYRIRTNSRWIGHLFIGLALLQVVFMIRSLSDG
ncbi:MAG: hypothetical protein AAGI11_20965 [Pseudomonadota bacterium]